MDALRELLACPVCGGALAAAWQCEACGARYTAPDGIPNLRLERDARDRTLHLVTLCFFYNSIIIEPPRRCSTLFLYRKRFIDTGNSYAVGIMVSRFWREPLRGYRD